MLSRERGGGIARVDPFPYLPSTLVRCSGYRATTRRRKPNLEINPMRSEALARRSNSRGDNRRQERKKKSEITRRIYAKSHMIADVRVRICMPYRSVGVRPWRVHGVTATKSSRTGRGKVTRPRSDDREGAGGSTQRARRCGDE